MTGVALYVVTFGSMLAYDWLWAKYTIYVSQKRAAMAALSSGSILLIGSAATLAMVSDTKALVPAVLGAMLGTYLAVKRSK